MRYIKPINPRNLGIRAGSLEADFAEKINEIILALSFINIEIENLHKTVKKKKEIV